MLTGRCVCDQLDAPYVPKATVPVALYNPEPNNPLTSKVNRYPVCSLGAVSVQLGGLAIHLCELESFEVCSSASSSVFIIDTDLDCLKISVECNLLYILFMSVFAEEVGLFRQARELLAWCRAEGHFKA